MNPRLVTLDLTHECNLRCIFCYYHSNHISQSHAGGNFKSALPVSTLVTNVVERTKCDKYYLTGGERFLYPHLEKLVKCLRQKKKSVSISTNGTLIDEFWVDRMVAEELFDDMTISIHGCDGVHDKITRKRGAFGLASKAIMLLQNCKEKQSGKKPCITINYIQNKMNVGELDKVVKLIDEWGVEHLTVGNSVYTTPEIIAAHKTFSRAVKLNEDFNLSSLVLGVPEHSMTEGQVQSYIRGLERLEKTNGCKYKIHRYPDYNNDEIYSHYLNKSWMYRSECRYAWNNLRILPTGEIIPCLGVVVGNIKEEKVDRIWNGKEFRKFRRTLYLNRLFPGCFRCCKLT